MITNAHPHPQPNGRACFTALLDKVNLIAVMLDTQTRIVYCNEYFLKLTGWTLEEITGRPWREIFLPHSVDLTELFGDLFQNKASAWHHENDIVTRDGQRRSIRWNNMILRDESGVAAAAASIGEDITERMLLEHELLNLSARERRKVQSELHDGLGQELFGVALTAKSLASPTRRKGRSRKEQLLALAAAASHAIETCRRIAQGMAPLSELHGDLFFALKQLTIMPDGWIGPRLQFSSVLMATLALSSDDTEQLYRIAQEGVTNALKHANANTIEVNLKVELDTVILTVADDGVGLPPETDAAPGLGLKLMRYRANLLQGPLRIERRPENGTRVILICPNTARDRRAETTVAHTIPHKT